MRRKLALLLAVFAVMVAAALASFVTPSRVAAQGASCQAQCKVAYDTCARAATNPGGLNQCKKAYESCLSFCH